MNLADVHIVTGAVHRWWCDRCHTTAGIRARVYVYAFTDGHDQPIHVGTMRRCTRCD